MGLGKLNPGCRPDPCSECLNCSVWLDNCVLRWRCNASKTKLVGVSPSLVTIVASDQPSGSLQNPPRGTYRLYADGKEVSKVVIDELPLGCCGPESPSCESRFPNMDGLRVHVVGSPIADLNGLYILYRPPFTTGIVRSSRLASPRTAPITGRGCPSIFNPNPPVLSFDYPHSYQLGCVAFRPVFRGQETQVLDVYVGVEMRVEVTNRAFRCSQDLTVSYSVGVLQVVRNATPNVFCNGGLIDRFITRREIGCNDPAGEPIVADLTWLVGEQGIANRDMTETYFTNCHKWGTGCCDYSIF